MKLKRKLCFLLTVVMLMTQFTTPVFAKAKASGPKVTNLNANQVEFQVNGKTAPKNITTTFDGTEKDGAFGVFVAEKKDSTTPLDAKYYAKLFQKKVGKKMVDLEPGDHVQNAGAYAFVVSGMNGYGKQIVKKITVEPFKVTADNVEVTTKLDGIAYDPAGATGAVDTVKVTVAPGKTYTLAEDVDYTVAYKNNKKAGTAKITIAFKGNYKGKISNNVVTVNKATSFGAYALGLTKVYKYNAKKPTVVPAVAMINSMNCKKKLSKNEYDLTYYVVSANDGRVADFTTAQTAEFKETEKVSSTRKISAGEMVVIRATGKGNFTADATSTILAPAYEDVSKKLTAKPTVVTNLNGTETFMVAEAKGETPAEYKIYKVYKASDLTLKFGDATLDPTDVYINIEAVIKKGKVTKITQTVYYYDVSVDGVITGSAIKTIVIKGKNLVEVTP